MLDIKNTVCAVLSRGEQQHLSSIKEKVKQEFSAAPMITPRIRQMADGRRAYGSIMSSLEDPHVAWLFKLLQTSRTFLDIGCGFGNMLCFAKLVNPKIRAVGIEPSLSESRTASRYADRIVNKRGESFMEYREFDLIYTYRPMVDTRDQLTLEEKIIQRMRPGAHFISVIPAHHLLLSGQDQGVYYKEEGRTYNQLHQPVSPRETISNGSVLSRLEVPSWENKRWSR